MLIKGSLYKNTIFISGPKNSKNKAVFFKLFTILIYYIKL